MEKYFVCDGLNRIPAGTTHLKTINYFNDAIHVVDGVTHLVFGYPLNVYRYQCFNTDSRIYTKITNYKYINYHYMRHS